MMESDVCVICLEEEGQLYKFCHCCYLAHLNCLQSYLNYEEHSMKKCACGRKIDSRVVQKLLGKEQKNYFVKTIPFLVLVIFTLILAILLSCQIAGSSERLISFCVLIDYFCRTTFYALSTIIYEIVYFSVLIANWVNITLFPIIYNCIISATDFIGFGFYTISKWLAGILNEITNILSICYPYVTEWLIFISRLIINWVTSFFKMVLLLVKNNSIYILHIGQLALESLSYALQNTLNLIISVCQSSVEILIIYGPIIYNSLSTMILNLMNFCKYAIAITIQLVTTYSPIVYEFLSSLFLLIFNWLRISIQNICYWVVTNGPKVYNSMSTSIHMIFNHFWEFSVMSGMWALEASYRICDLIILIADISLKGYNYIEELCRFIFIDTAPTILEYFIDFCQNVYNSFILMCQVFHHYIEEFILTSGKIVKFIYTVVNYLIDEYCIVLVKYFYIVFDYFLLFGTQIIFIISNIIQSVYYIGVTFLNSLALFLINIMKYAYSIAQSFGNYFSIFLLKLGYILYNWGQIFVFWILSVFKITFDLMMRVGPSVFEWIFLLLQYIYFWLISTINVTYYCFYIVFKNTFSSLVYICDIAVSDEVFSSKVLDLCSHITSKWLISIGQVITDWIISLVHISGHAVFTIMQFTYTSVIDILFITYGWLQLLLETSANHFTIDWF